MAEELTAREEALLLGLLARYLSTREPVGSKVLAEQSPEPLSPATVRHALARLEEKGFLAQPHTSAGRVPTDRAYRYLALAVVREDPAKSGPGDGGLERLLAEASVSGIAREASGALARAVHTLGFAVTPCLGAVRLQTCELIRITENRVLCLVVSRSGHAHEKVVNAPELYTQEQLRWFSNYLNETFAGCTFTEIRVRLQAQVESERARCDALVRGALEMAAPCLIEFPASRELYWDGATWLLDAPELQSDLGCVRSLLDSLEKKEGLIGLVDRLISESGLVRVVLGEDWPDPSVKGLAMVAAPFGGESTGRGVLGVIGPKALRYERAIPSVREAARLATMASERL